MRSFLLAAALFVSLLLGGVPGEAAHRLPIFEESSHSDGCSFSPDWSPSIRAICVAHDRAYYYGGSAEDRQRADQRLYQDLRATRFPFAWLYWAGVRVGGGPQLRIRGVSWAFGGAVFRYTGHPALPATAG